MTVYLACLAWLWLACPGLPWIVVYLLVCFFHAASLFPSCNYDYVIALTVSLSFYQIDVTAVLLNAGYIRLSSVSLLTVDVLLFHLFLFFCSVILLHPPSNTFDSQQSVCFFSHRLQLFPCSYDMHRSKQFSPDFSNRPNN